MKFAIASVLAVSAFAAADPVAKKIPAFYREDYKDILAKGCDYVDEKTYNARREDRNMPEEIFKKRNECRKAAKLSPHTDVSGRPDPDDKDNKAFADKCKADGDKNPRECGEKVEKLRKKVMWNCLFCKNFGAEKKESGAAHLLVGYAALATAVVLM